LSTWTPLLIALLVSLTLKCVENSSCLQAPPETPRRCIHCHPVHVPNTPNNYMQHPMQYYTPTHCMEGQNGTYTPHRGSSYHGGEFTFQLVKYIPIVYPEYQLCRIIHELPSVISKLILFLLNFNLIHIARYIIPFIFRKQY